MIKDKKLRKIDGSLPPIADYKTKGMQLLLDLIFGITMMRGDDNLFLINYPITMHVDCEEREKENS